MKNYLETVRNQYENYPYPLRNPNDETNRLISTNIDNIYLINHYCFNGKLVLSKNSDNKFKILVAGGGTGDSLIFLAETLRNFNVEITYLDMSKASMNIAKKRAKVRLLNNIKWIHGSLLDLPNMNIGNFDYINCTGVLHHLESPLNGLNALKSVLNKDGCIGIMVYGLYGRTAIYQVQNLMKLINQNEDNLQVKVSNTKSILNDLGEYNIYNLSKNFICNPEINEFGDIGIYDLFLHSKDRAYTIPELYNWIEEDGKLKIIEFIGEGIISKAAYDPLNYIKDYSIRECVSKMSDIKQKEIAELISGSIYKHTFYVTNRNDDTVASIDDESLVPHFLSSSIDFHTKCAEFIKSNEGVPLKLILNGYGEISMKTTPVLQRIFEYTDGNNTIEEIKKKVNADDKVFKSELNRLLNLFSSFNLMVLKSKEF